MQGPTPNYGDVVKLEVEFPISSMVTKALSLTASQNPRFEQTDRIGISATSRSDWFALRRIGCQKPSLQKHSLNVFGKGWIISVLFGLSAALVDADYYSRQYNTAPLRRSLHWLPVKERVG